MQADEKTYEEYQAFQEFQRQRSESQSQQSEKKKPGKKKSRAREQAERAFPVMVSWAMVGLIAIVAITNIRAWHAALGLYLKLKFEGTYTLGGLLINPLFDGVFRLFILGLIAYVVFFRKREKSWFDWVGVVLMSIAVAAGSASLTAQGSWVLAVVLWYVFQCLQFEGIFEASNSAVRFAAFATYLLEFAVQCAQAPISELGFLELMDKFSTGTLAAGDIDWWMVLVNILCMAGVEGLIRLKMNLEKSNG